MSIAVSTSVFPSRRLQCAVYGVGLIVIISGAVVGTGLTGHFSFPVRVIVALASLGVALVAVVRFSLQQRVWYLALSATGGICLGESDEGPLVEYRMLPDSTLWAGLMLLRLQNEAGHTVVLRILPDSVSPEAFRALSVALRWIAARGAQPDAAETPRL